MFIGKNLYFCVTMSFFVKIVSLPSKITRYFSRPPRILRLGLVNVCNLRCPFCDLNADRKDIGKPKLKYMSDEVFFKSIERAIEAGVFKSVHFVHFGEALLHKNFFQYVSYVKKKGFDAYLVTNGVLIDRYLKEIFESKLDKVKISIDTLEPVAYQKYRVGSDIKKVLKNLESLYSEKKRLGSELGIHVQGMFPTDLYEPGVDLEEKKADFKRVLANKCDTITFTPLRTDEQIGNSIPHIKDCQMIGNIFSVLPDGRVTTCCIDSTGEMLVGNITERNLRKIWRGKPAFKLKTKALLSTPPSFYSA